MMARLPPGSPDGAAEPGFSPKNDEPDQGFSTSGGGEDPSSKRPMVRETVGDDFVAPKLSRASIHLRLVSCAAAQGLTARRILMMARLPPGSPDGMAEPGSSPDNDAPN